jgi:hypothetical protein
VPGPGLRVVVLVVVFSFAVGCGGSAHVTPDASAAPGGGVQSNPQADAPGSDAVPSALRDASVTDDAHGDASDDGPPPISWDGRVPVQHRASATPCPQTYDAGGVGFDCPDTGAPPLPGNPCTVDSDCTAGMDGVCLCYPDICSASVPPPNTGQDSGVTDPCYQDGGLTGLYTGTVCSYDECRVDSDCGQRVPCYCRDPNIFGEPNVCLPASKCALDSDCSPPGFCSPSYVANQSPPLGFFCHTQDDTCVDDSDCASFGPYGASCQFDTTSDIWHCVAFPPPP